MKFGLKTLLTVTVSFFPVLAEAGAIDQLHAFLQSTRTLKAEFAQVVIAKNGRKPQQSSGLVSISRPGKLRWEIIKAGQAISGSPAALLAGNNDLEKNFTLKEAGEAEGMAWVEATPKAGDSGFEKVRLGFAGANLKAMELQDSFGQTTHVSFSKLERNPTLPGTKFKFTPPAGVDVVGE